MLEAGLQSRPLLALPRLCLLLGLWMDGWIKGDRLEGEERGDHIKVRR